MEIFSRLRNPMQSFTKKREEKQQRLDEYKALLSLMSSTGIIIYQGVPYRSIADFTIQFFKN